jgi:DNA-binding MarR family transcriptional regulator/GNAT superfamily N-acetyltransferase
MRQEQVASIRRFNRVLTLRVGALDQSYLRRGRPLGEARVLFELAHAADLRDLRAKLGLDSGYLSRLLRSLEKQQLIVVSGHAADARVRRARLTAKGRAEYRAYEKLSDALAHAILEPLEEHERAELTSAMRRVERLIGLSAVEVEVVAPASREAKYCLGEYFRELARRFDAGFDPRRSNPLSEAEMAAPAGMFVVARLEGRIAGCGALKIGKGVGEIKRMWTHPSARGHGVARVVLRRLEHMARDRGVNVLRLETNRALKEAQALYRSEGFREVAAFNAEAYAHHWFEKTLQR